MFWRCVDAMVEDMKPTFPEFERPPIVELVLGVQFAPLAQLTSAHFGWFWKQYLGEEWERPSDAPPLPDQFEFFGDQHRWQSIFPFLLKPGIEPGRVQIGNQGMDRLIQIQPSRLHYNWKKKDGSYPSFGKISEEFSRCFGQFQNFVAKAQLGELLPNQWEITYVDSMPQGELWNTVSDWYAVLPGLFPKTPAVDGLKAESFVGKCSYEIVPSRGRVHVEANLARLGENGQTALLLQTTARGPIGKDGAADLKSGLQLGHDAVVEVFLKMTSVTAQKHWGVKS
jgi:uncharacterized protein (TIGR04255 family)